jgi:hypothetical protein
MDPYLEVPTLWPDFHKQLLALLRDVLSSGLPEQYESILGLRRLPPSASANGQEHPENFLEIRHRGDGRLVTLLEVVSPANKTTDAGRQAYLEQQRQAQDAQANLAEIDLVLQGQPTLDYAREGLPKWHYAVTVTRVVQPQRHEIYTATLEKRLPRFRLPLGPEERDTVLDLQAAFTRCFVEGGYYARIDYCQDPPVPLSDEDGRWLDVMLRSQGLRPVAPSHEDVSLAAYYLWEREGRPHGREREHWRRALAQLRRASHSARGDTG